ncbi:MAG TPA: YciI family protein [Gemmatimonadaceae bacterium]|nr:YciI family protein [Gemmatimonadaceae bacterium]
MRFMTIYKPAAPEGTPPSQEHMEAMGRFIEELASEGVLLQTDGLLPSARGARVRLDNGKYTVRDGPFTESKELIAGYAIIDVGSLDEAVELTRRFLQIAGDGESEIRQMYDAPAYEKDPINGPEYPLAS